MLGIFIPIISSSFLDPFLLLFCKIKGNIYKFIHNTQERYPFDSEVVIILGYMTKIRPFWDSGDPGSFLDQTKLEALLDGVSDPA